MLKFELVTWNFFMITHIHGHCIRYPSDLCISSIPYSRSLTKIDDWTSLMHSKIKNRHFVLSLMIDKQNQRISQNARGFL